MKTLQRLALGMVCAACFGVSPVRGGPVLEWRVRASGTTQHLNSVAHGNGRYVAVGQEGLVVTSPDGRTWTLQPALPVETLSGA